MSAVGCWAIVPVKPLSTALGRLADALDSGERYALQGAMLRDVLRACAGTQALSGTLVVTADPAAEAVARREGAEVVRDHVPPRGMNAAVRRGVAGALDHGAHSALVLTADLPLVNADDLGALARWPLDDGDVVLAPSRDGTGTNAMLLRPPTVIDPALGPDSLAQHVRRARVCGVVPVTVALPSVALDIDTPEDLEQLRRSRTPCLARRVFDVHREPATAGSTR